jgi:hypothetical protein
MGHNTYNAYANTTAYQTNYVWADQHQDVYAGIGGNGGSSNQAELATSRSICWICPTPKCLFAAAERVRWIRGSTNRVKPNFAILSTSSTS